MNRVARTRLLKELKTILHEAQQRIAELLTSRYDKKTDNERSTLLWELERLADETTYKDRNREEMLQLLLKYVKDDNITRYFVRQK